MNNSFETSSSSGRASMAPLSPAASRSFLRPRSATLSRRELRRIVEEVIG